MVRSQFGTIVFIGLFRRVFVKVNEALELGAWLKLQWGKFFANELGVDFHLEVSRFSE